MYLEKKVHLTPATAEPYARQFAEHPQDGEVAVRAATVQDLAGSLCQVRVPWQPGRIPEVLLDV